MQDAIENTADAGDFAVEQHKDSGTRANQRAASEGMSERNAFAHGRTMRPYGRYDQPMPIEFSTKLILASPPPNDGGIDPAPLIVFLGA